MYRKFRLVCSVRAAEGYFPWRGRLQAWWKNGGCCLGDQVARGRGHARQELCTQPTTSRPLSQVSGGRVVGPRSPDQREGAPAQGVPVGTSSINKVVGVNCVYIIRVHGVSQTDAPAAVGNVAQVASVRQVAGVDGGGEVEARNGERQKRQDDQ